MKIQDVPFTTIQWSEMPPTAHPGATGISHWRTWEMGNIRLRMVEYSADYLADHWCSRGHVLLVLEGELGIELEDGRKFLLKPGMSFHVTDDIDAHRAYAEKGARVFIVD